VLKSSKHPEKLGRQFNTYQWEAGADSFSSAIAKPTQLFTGQEIVANTACHNY